MATKPEESTTSEETRPRRTNSLAFATTDCHKCADDGIKCDRSRPCCTTCVKKGIKCPGFVTPLSWDQRRMFVARPKTGSGGTEQDKDYSAAEKSKDQSERHHKPQKKFRFVEKPAPKRRKLTTDAPRSSMRPMRRPTAADAADGSVETTTLPIIVDPIESEITDGVGHDTALCNPVPLDFEQDTPLQFMPSLTINGMPTSFDQDLSWDESAEGSCSLTSDSSQYDIDAGHEMSMGTSAQFMSQPAVDVNTLDGSALPPSDFNAFDGTIGPIGISNLSELQSLVTSSLNEHGITQDFTDAPAGALSIPPAIEPCYEILLNMYDSELCVLPVTYDIRMNPFRRHRDMSRGSRLLYHSIMALSYQHLNHNTSNWPKEAQDHRHRAGEELTLALTNLRTSDSNLHLLDPILIIFTLECTRSASGPWTYYLTQAASILEASGGVLSLQHPRVRSQVAMLCWWDATLALVSREGLILDPSYYEYLFEHEAQDEWSFYDLSGCPSVLFKLLVELAQLAAQQEVAQSMKWLTFDPTPAWAIEKQLREAILDMDAESLSEGNNLQQQGSRTGFCVNIDDEASFDGRAEEEEINRQSDTLHCLEAWRWGLLTYTYRVFMVGRTRPPSKPDAPAPAVSNTSRPRLWTATSRLAAKIARSQSQAANMSLGGSLARRMMIQSIRETLNHVAAVRRSSQIQKQLLLPVFWAGSETSDPDLRNLARTYCEWWADRSRYQMFASVPVLFESIWSEVDHAAQLPSGAAMPWWGSVVNSKTKGSPGMQKSGINFLFG